MDFFSLLHFLLLFFSAGFTFLWFTLVIRFLVALVLYRDQLSSCTISLLYAISLSMRRLHMGFFYSLHIFNCVCTAHIR